MTTRQYNFFVKQISTLHTSKLGDYTFNIKNRYDDIYELEQLYKGSSVNQKVKGRAEKLSSKFEAGKQTMTAKPVEKKVKTSKKQNVVKSLDDLK